MWVSSFCTTLLWNIFPFKNKWEIYNGKYISVSTYSTCYSCPILMILELSRQILEKYANTVLDFMKIRPVGAQLFHGNGRTWRS
jgi:hypothetical protein